MVPQTTIPVDGGEAKQVLNLIESLEELDDVQNVYANFDIPEEVMASLVSEPRVAERCVEPGPRRDGLVASGLRSWRSPSRYRDWTDPASTPLVRWFVERDLVARVPTGSSDVVELGMGSRAGV